MFGVDDQALVIARERGWDESLFQEALDNNDEDAITLQHPINWLTEDEAEEYFA